DDCASGSNERTIPAILPARAKRLSNSPDPMRCSLKLVRLPEIRPPFRILGLSTRSMVDLDPVAYEWSEEHPVCFRKLYRSRIRSEPSPKSGPVKRAGLWLHGTP